MNKSGIRSKISVSEIAIEHCRKLLRNESIELNGQNRIVIVRNENMTDEHLNKMIADFEKRIIKLSHKLNSF